MLASVLASMLVAAGCGNDSEFGSQPRFTADGGIESGVDPLSRGKRHFSNGNFGLAIEAFEEARLIAPASVNVLNALAVAYEEVGRSDLADSYFLEALDLDPASSQTYNNWAMAQLGRGNGAKAEELLVEAARLAPGDGVVIANIARVANETALPSSDQAMAPAVPGGSLAAIIAELEPADDRWGPSIQSVAPHVSFLKTLAPGNVAAAASDGALPVVLYPQSAAANILPLPDAANMAPPPPAVPVVPVFTAVLGTLDANGGEGRPMAATAMTSAVPVHYSLQSMTDEEDVTLLASSEPRHGSPHFFAGAGARSDGEGVSPPALPDPAVVRPFHDTLQDTELAAMQFLPTGPEPNPLDGALVAVSSNARIVGLEATIAIRPEPMAIGTWSTVPVPPVVRTASVPLVVVPFSAPPAVATGTIVVPYEPLTPAPAAPSAPAMGALLPAPAPKPDLLGIHATAALPAEAAPAPIVPADPADPAPSLMPTAETGATTNPGFTALAAVPPLAIADALRDAILPAIDGIAAAKFEATSRIPIVVATAAASESVAPPAAIANTDPRLTTLPRATAARISTVVAAFALTDQAEDEHADDNETVR
ncbi:MAG: hypothetical protein WD715_12250 [Dongiaceae bacterium]